jgi:hypothetical protein
MEVIDIWCELKLPRTDCTLPQLLQAHPNLDNFGGFFDWVDASLTWLGRHIHGSDEGFTVLGKQKKSMLHQPAAFVSPMGGCHWHSVSVGW